MKTEVISGKMSMLLPIADYELKKLCDLLRGDKNGDMGKFSLREYSAEQAEYYMRGLINSGQIFVWAVYTNNDEPELGGFIYLSDVSNYIVSLHGIMDRDFGRKKIARGMPLDAAKALIDYCFMKGVNRVETDVCQTNRRALALDRKLGFVKEGVLRGVIIKNTGMENLVIMSILKEEWEKRNANQAPSEKLIKETSDGKRENAHLQST